MAKAKFEPCPKCGQSFDPAEDQVVECPECGSHGSTKCCNPGGAGCLCLDCEEGETDQDEDEK